MTITLALTEEQAEILGFALTKTRRQQQDTADAAKPGGPIQQGCRERAQRLEELRNLLDVAPCG